MKSRNIAYRIILLLFLGLHQPISIFSQFEYQAEKVDIWTDRYLFISGETIQFAGVLSADSKENILSEVIYVELITATGQKISQVKIKLSSTSFEGKIVISPEILSGYYTLRAYTKWMRNGDPTDYAQIRLKVVNPFSDEIKQVDDSLLDNSLPLLDNKSSYLSLNKATYEPGEQVHYILDTTFLTANAITSFSIIPAIAAPFEKQSDLKISLPYQKIIYYPETRGITISGKIIRSGDRSLLPYHRVNIHLENEKDFISVLSDSTGSFYMALPERYGSIELFVIAATLENENVELLIDQDFCTKEIAIKMPLFSINDEEKKQVLKMAQAYQLYSLYKTNDSLSLDLQNDLPFYGKAFKTIELDDYVVLDSLAQYFSDLPSWVRVKEVKGNRKIMLSGYQSGLQLYEALIMVDWVPVDDAERILAMDPARIKNFDVVISPYIHGGITYGGILSISTRKSDFGGLVFPKSGVYINYGFYDRPRDLKVKIQNDFSFKNTTTWVADITKETYLSGKDIVAPTIDGDYILLLQSIDKEGNRTEEWIEFEVNSVVK